MVKLTGGQRIDLLGVRKEDLPKVWADLDMPSGYAYGKSFRTVKTCVGTDFCRFGLGDSTALGIAIEERYQGLEGPAQDEARRRPAARATAPRRYVKDLGVVAVDGGRWEIYVGGAAGAHIRKGDLLATVDTPEEVITLTGRFLQYYRENGELARAHLRVRAPDRHRAAPRDRRGRRRGHRRRPRRRDASVRRRLPGPLEGARRPGRRPASSARPCR